MPVTMANMLRHLARYTFNNIFFVAKQQATSLSIILLDMLLHAHILKNYSYTDLRTAHKVPS